MGICENSFNIFPCIYIPPLKWRMPNSLKILWVFRRKKYTMRNKFHPLYFLLSSFRFYFPFYYLPLYLLLSFLIHLFTLFFLSFPWFTSFLRFSSFSFFLPSPTSFSVFSNCWKVLNWLRGIIINKSYRH